MSLSTLLATGAMSLRSLLPASIAASTTGTVLVGVATVLLLVIVLEQARFRVKAAGLPGPQWVVPLMGGIVHMVSDAFDFWHQSMARGSVSWNSIVGQFVVVVTEASAVRKIFASCSEQMPLALHPNAFTLLGKDNIAFLNGTEHRALRARLLPLFTTRALAMYVGIQADSVRQYLERWVASKPTAAAPLLIRPAVYDLNTFTSMRAFMGPHIADDERDQLTEDYSLLTTGMYGFPINLPGFALYAGAKARPRILRLLENVVRKSKIAMSETSAEATCLLDVWMMSTLAAQRDAESEGRSADSVAHSSDADCAKILLDFIFAAQDASTASLTWSTHFLAKFPEVLRQVREEVASVHAAQDPTRATPVRIDADVLPSLKYTWQVMREVLRLCPPATIVPHQTLATVFHVPADPSSSDAASAAGYTIPKGSLVVPSIWSANRQGFSNPDSFDPDRFSAERAEDKKYADNFLTFGVGPHMCMGQRYAMNHLVTFIALLAYEVDFTRLSTPTEEQIKYLPTIYPVDDCPLQKVEKRNWLEQQ